MSDRPGKGAVDKDFGLEKPKDIPHTLHPRDATSFQVNLRESYTPVFLKLFTIVSYVKSIVRFVSRKLLEVGPNKSIVFEIQDSHYVRHPSYDI